MPAYEVAEVLRFEADRLDGDHRALRRLQSALRPAPGFFYGLVAKLLAAFLHRHAKSIEVAAFTFRGLAEKVRAEPSDAPIDPEDRVRTLLDRLQDQVDHLSQDCAEAVAKWRADKDARNGVISAAVEQIGIACDDFVRETRFLKGAVQAHDADVEARYLARFPTKAPAESLEDQLSRIAA